MTALVEAAELDAILAILADGRAFQRAQGFVQWADGYPDRATILADIAARRGRVLRVDGETAGYLCLSFDGEPVYGDIEGAWLQSGPYGVVHRIAIGEGFRGRGLASEAFRLASEACVSRGVGSIRADTGEKNARMRHILAKNGFQLCGTVYYAGSPRLAFEKLL